ncbi:tetratricopeptide repeat protein [Abyssibius alkaniclasticus]|uniref:tetratricopeptide repeat protein n=1 Tax=Abyssibius alkaniclasticus TaxID=2881234 RepID=UPI003082533E
MILRKGVALLALAGSLAACMPDGRIATERRGPPPPPGTVRITEAVDGLQVGHNMMAAGEYQLALDAYVRGIEEHGLNADVLSAIGSANLRLGRLNQAVRYLERAVELDEDFAAAWNNLGVIYIAQNEIPKARGAFERAFALDNGDSDEIRQNLVLALSLLGDTSQETAEDVQFRLVRRGAGRYLLLGQ